VPLSCTYRLLRLNQKRRFLSAPAVVVSVGMRRLSRPSEQPLAALGGGALRPPPLLSSGLIGLVRRHIAAHRLDDLVDVAHEHGGHACSRRLRTQPRSGHRC
jgi:hypothetical protein